MSDAVIGRESAGSAVIGGGAFGPWLARRRKSRDLTREELASLVNCATSTLRKVEGGERRASKELAARLALALGFPEGEIGTFVAFARRGPAGPRWPAAGGAGAEASEPGEAVPVAGLRWRRRELEELGALLSRGDCRLLTVTGLRGSGKSRLVRELARRAAAGLGSRRSRGRGAEAEILVLEEPSLDPSGLERVAEALRLDPSLHVLCSSLSPLGLREEIVYGLGGLSCEWRGGAGSPGLSDAADFFVESLLRYRARRAPASDSLAAIRRICEGLAGHPLGLELAASWARHLSLGQIASMIEADPLCLAVEGLDLPLRHRSFRAAVEESCAAFAEGELRALARLGEETGGAFSAEEALAAGVAIPRLLALVGRALVLPAPAARFRLHPLLARCSRGPRPRA